MGRDTFCPITGMHHFGSRNTVLGGVWPGRTRLLRAVAGGTNSEPASQEVLAALQRGLALSSMDVESSSLMAMIGVTGEPTSTDNLHPNPAPRNNLFCAGDCTCAKTPTHINETNIKEVANVRVWNDLSYDQYFDADEASKFGSKARMLDYHPEHGSGVAVNCKVQVEGCGDALLKLIATRPHTCIKEMDPKIIVQHIVRTCTVHLERKLDSLAQSVSKEVMDRIRGFPFLKTQGECDEFVEFCQNSEYKCVRDWINDKKSSPWFIPSLNQYMSKIPEEDWLLTPGDTNLNESAHPFTNLHIGINLKLLDAVKNARVLDLDVAERIALAEKNCILPNHRNTKPERDHNNRKRQEARARKLTARQEATAEVLDIVGELSVLTEAQQSIKERAKELHQRKKDIQVTEGIRRSPLKPSARGKLTIPMENDILLESDDLPILQGSETGFGDSENQHCDYLNDDTPPSPSPSGPPVQRLQTSLPCSRRSWAAVPVSYRTSLGLNSININASTSSITAAPHQHHNIQSEVSISDLTALYGGRVPSLHELMMQFPHRS